MSTLQSQSLVSRIESTRSAIDARFLRLWSQSVGTQAYNKQEWMDLQALLYDIIYCPKCCGGPGQEGGGAA